MKRYELRGCECDPNADFQQSDLGPWVTYEDAIAAAAAEREAIAVQGEELAATWRKAGHGTDSAAVSDFVDAIRKRGAL